MTFVLRQIHAPGKSPLADSVTAISLAKAVIAREVQYGQYLQWSDPDANDGMGAEGWTSDVRRAKKFPTFALAMECWKAQSNVRPIRDDGKPNRPLTAFSVTPERLEG